ncbi:MAG: hypothetical protein AB8B55_15735 [Mariniblastus sp.]
MKPIDPLQLQRLVDGELDNQQIQELLREAETESGQWREIATGFVENQIWNRAFQAKNPSSGDASSSKIIVEPQSKTSVRSSLDQHPDHLSGRTAFSWWVVAASLLTAVTIGYMANQIQNRDLPNTLVENKSPVPVESHDDLDLKNGLADNLPPRNTAPRNAVPNLDQPKMTPASLQAPYHLEVPQDSQQFGQLANESTTVPLFNISNQEQLDQLRQQKREPVIPPRLLKRLQGSGYQMQENVKYISGKLSDGRSFVVPVRTIRVVPGQ